MLGLDWWDGMRRLGAYCTSFKWRIRTAVTKYSGQESNDECLCFVDLVSLMAVKG